MRSYRITVHFVGGAEKVFNQPDKKLYDAYSDYVYRRNSQTPLPASWELMDEDRTVMLDLEKITWMSLKEVAAEEPETSSPAIIPMH